VPLGPGSRLGPYEIDSAIGAGGPACTNRRTLNLPGEGHLRRTPDGRGVAYIDGATQRNVWVQPLDAARRISSRTSPTAPSPTSPGRVTPRAWRSPVRR